MLIKDNIIDAFKQTKKETFSLDEIISIINQVTNNTELPIIESCGVKVNPALQEIVVNEKHIKVPNKVFALMYYLITNKNKVIKRKELLRDIWGTEVWVVERTIDVHIRKLRRIVGKHNLSTIKCVGYGWFEK